jgi:hypothetical protein
VNFLVANFSQFAPKKDWKKEYFVNIPWFFGGGKIAKIKLK